MSRPVVLMTDFGDSEYVGVMRGVVMSRSPASPLVDLAHDIGPQGVREGAWLLWATYRWFPRSSVFLCVVDPGVGTKRRAIALRTASYFFVGPDNGLMWKAAQSDGIEACVELPVDWTASRTFHGRDVFAPAAGRLAAGEALEELGDAIADPVPLEFHQRGREGEVCRIDRFGNCITNLEPIPGRKTYEAWIEAGSLPETIPFYEAYQHAPNTEPFLIQNAYGTLEIACKNGSAQSMVGTAVGSRVRFA